MAQMYLATIFGNAARNQPARVEERARQPPPVIEIVDFGDLVVQVYKDTETGDRFNNSNGYNVSGKLLASFKVSRQVLMRNSPKFETMLDPDGKFAEAKQKIIDLKNNSAEAIEIWFRLFHKKFNEDSYKLKLDDLRAVIECHREHLFHLEKLNAWFATWMEHNGGSDYGKFSLDHLRGLLYPCQEFDHAEGFMYATRKLSYETPGHVREDLPTAFGHLHLEPRIICKSSSSDFSLFFLSNETNDHFSKYQRCPRQLEDENPRSFVHQ